MAAALRTLAGMVLLSPAPMLLWGPELAQLHNDRFAGLAGAAHPARLGQPARQAWPRAAGLLEHLFEHVLQHGEALTIGPGHPHSPHGPLPPRCWTAPLPSTSTARSAACW